MVRDVPPGSPRQSKVFQNLPSEEQISQINARVGKNLSPLEVKAILILEKWETLCRMLGNDRQADQLQTERENIEAGETRPFTPEVFIQDVRIPITDCMTELVNLLVPSVFTGCDLSEALSAIIETAPEGITPQDKIIELGRQHRIALEIVDKISEMDGLEIDPQIKEEKEAMEIRLREAVSEANSEEIKQLTIESSGILTDVVRAFLRNIPQFKPLSVRADEVGEDRIDMALNSCSQVFSAVIELGNSIVDVADEADLDTQQIRDRLKVARGKGTSSDPQEIASVANKVVHRLTDFTEGTVRAAVDTSVADEQVGNEQIQTLKRQINEISASVDQKREQIKELLRLVNRLRKTGSGRRRSTRISGSVRNPFPIMIQIMDDLQEIENFEQISREQMNRFIDTMINILLTDPIMEVSSAQLQVLEQIAAEIREILQDVQNEPLVSRLEEILSLFQKLDR